MSKEAALFKTCIVKQASLLYNSFPDPQACWVEKRNTRDGAYSVISRNYKALFARLHQENLVYTKFDIDTGYITNRVKSREKRARPASLVSARAASAPVTAGDTSLSRLVADMYALSTRSATTRNTSDRPWLPARLS